LSVGPPAENGTTKVIGRSPGKSAALAAETLTPTAQSEIAAKRIIDGEIFTGILAFSIYSYRLLV
jgi:hypothetical protein